MPQSISAKMRARPHGLKGFAASERRAIGLNQTLPLAGITNGQLTMMRARGLNTIYCVIMATKYRITELMSDSNATVYHMQIVCPKCGHNIWEKIGENCPVNFPQDDEIIAECASDSCVERFRIPLGRLRGKIRMEEIPPLPF